MTAAYAPPRAEARTLMVEAMICRIDAIAGDGFPAARDLLLRLDASGLGHVIAGADATTLRLYGITATASGSPWAVLSNWRNRASAWLAGTLTDGPFSPIAAE